MDSLLVIAFIQLAFPDGRATYFPTLTNKKIAWPQRVFDAV
jgi:hypothetical protein